MKVCFLKKRFCLAAAVMLLVSTVSACGGDGDTHSSIELPVNYEGSLDLHITNDYPAYDESTKVDVKVSKQGVVTFGSGTLHWDAENQLEEGKTKWVGDLNINPTGKVSDCGGKVCIEVNENTTYTETVEQYVMMNGSWKKVADDTQNGTWDGGLVFYLDDAIVDGSVVTASSEQGTVTWTLILLASLTD